MTVMHPSQNDMGTAMRQPEHRGKPRTCSTCRRVRAQYLTLTLPVCNRLVSSERVCLSHVACSVGRLHSFVTHTTRRYRYYVQEHLVQKQHVVGRQLANGIRTEVQKPVAGRTHDEARAKLSQSPATVCTFLRLPSLLPAAVAPHVAW